MALALCTLAVGFVAGWLGQRSRMCFIGGYRDYLLVRDKDLIKGTLAFFLSAWLVLRVAGLLLPELPVAPQPALDLDLLQGSFAWVTLGGGFALGFLVTLSDACPLRHHVLAGQGRLDSAWFIGGMLGGAALFHFLAPKLPFL